MNVKREYGAKGNRSGLVDLVGDEAGKSRSEWGNEPKYGIEGSKARTRVYRKRESTGKSEERERAGNKKKRT